MTPTRRRDGYLLGDPDVVARWWATASTQGTPSRTTSARHRRSGAGRAAPTPRQAAAAGMHERVSSWCKAGSPCLACRLADTRIVAQSTTAAPAHSTQAVATGVRLSWAWLMRETIAAPMAAMLAVRGRWPSIHCAVAGRVGLGWRCPVKTKYVHHAPKPTTTATSPTLRLSALSGWLARPATAP